MNKPICEPRISMYIWASLVRSWNLDPRNKNGGFLGPRQVQWHGFQN